MNEINKSFTGLIIETQKTTQATHELSGTLWAIKNRYHPVIWFLLSLKARMGLQELKR